MKSSMSFAVKAAFIAVSLLVCATAAAHSSVKTEWAFLILFGLCALPPILGQVATLVFVAVYASTGLMATAMLFIVMNLAIVLAFFISKQLENKAANSRVQRLRVPASHIPRGM